MVIQVLKPGSLARCIRISVVQEMPPLYITRTPEGVSRPSLLTVPWVPSAWCLLAQQLFPDCLCLICSHLTKPSPSIVALNIIRPNLPVTSNLIILWQWKGIEFFPLSFTVVFLLFCVVFYLIGLLAERYLVPSILASAAGPWQTVVKLFHWVEGTCLMS